MQHSSGCACAGVTHRTACRYRARRFPSSLVPSQPPLFSILPYLFPQLYSQPPPSLFLSFRSPAFSIPLRLLPRSPSFAEISCTIPLVYVLGIYEIRSRLRDTVPSPPLRFAATSQIRFVPPSDYFSVVPHSTDRPSSFSFSLYER